MNKEHVCFKDTYQKQIEHEMKSRPLKSMLTTLEEQRERPQDLKHEKQSTGKVSQPYACFYIHIAVGVGRGQRYEKQLRLLRFQSVK